MKKLTLIFMAALLVIAASSCKKDKDNENENDDTTTTTTTTANDGVFNPSKKIYKYYYWDNYDELKRLGEVWHWDENRLSSIDDMNSNGSVARSFYYSYGNDRLVRIDYSNSYTSFQYSNGRLIKVSMYYYDELESEFSFSYGSNGKVDVISGKYYDSKKTSRGIFSPMDIILPEQFAGSIDRSRERREAKRGSKEDGIETITIKLTWTGDNVTKYVMEDEYSEGEFSEVLTAQMTASYDNRPNPKWGFMGRRFIGESIEVYYSKNNVTKYTYTEHEIEYENGVLDGDHSSTHEGSLTYQYDDDDYPVVVTETEVSSSGNTNTSKYYYEYL